MVCVNFKDHEQCHAEASDALQRGFDGKQVRACVRSRLCARTQRPRTCLPLSQAIHPAQIDIIHRAFRPSRAIEDYARRIVAANEQHQQRGTGAFTVSGPNGEAVMIDMPLVRWAHGVLRRCDVGASAAQ